jgi:hypothetical protein
MLQSGDLLLESEWQTKSDLLGEGELQVQERLAALRSSSRCA